MKKKHYVNILVFSLLLSSCGAKRRIETARGMSVDIALPSAYIDTESARKMLPDTLARFTDKEGIAHTIGMTSLDQKTGEQLLTVGLQEVKVTARFRNVAERKGVVRIAFDVEIPPELMNDDWELYLTPKSDVSLPGIVVMGENFRRKQQRQYEYYNELRKVVLPDNDAERFINRKELEKTLARHNRETLREAKLSFRKSLPTSAYRLSSPEDTAAFVSRFMDKTKVNRNEYFKRILEKEFGRIVTLSRRQGVKESFVAKEDSVLNATYSIELPASETISRITLRMEGEIRTLGADTYPVCASDSLSFIVTSLRSFIEDGRVGGEDYNRGVRLLKDGDYKAAVELLRPYSGINTAVCYLSLGFDRMAYNILSSLPPSADHLYLKALALWRLKKEKEAAEFYKESCRKDPSKVWRGNLDPEIRELIAKYRLNND